MTRGPKPSTPRRHRRQPKLPAAELAAPSWLSADAATEWARIAPELRAAGILTVVDMASLASYCESFAELQALTRELQTADAAARPDLYRLRGATVQRIAALGRSLGLSPRARLNMQAQAPPPPPGASFDDVIGGP